MPGPSGRRHRDDGADVCYGVAMSNETENENRQRIDKLQNDFEKSEIQRKANDKVQEANMKTLEAAMRELVAENKAASEKALAENKAASEKSLSETKLAFERLQVAVERSGKWQMAFTATLAGVVIAAVGVIFVWPGI